MSLSMQLEEHEEEVNEVIEDSDSGPLSISKLEVTLKTINILLMNSCVYF